MSDQTACPSCGATFPATAAFCPQCGTAHAPAQAEGASTRSGEGEVSGAEGTSGSFATGPGASDGSAGTAGDDDRTRLDVPAQNPAGHDPTQVLPSYETANPGGAPPSWTTPAPTEAPAWNNPPPQDPPSWSTPGGAPPQPQAAWGNQPSGPPMGAPSGPPPAWGGGPAAAAPGYAGAHAQVKAKKDNSVPGGILAILGGIAAIVSAFLVWIKVNFAGIDATGKGWDSTPDAKIVLAIGIAAVAIGVALFLTRHAVLRLLLAAAGIGAVAVAVRDMLDVSSFGKSLRAQGATGQSIGVGLYVVAAAGVVLLIAAAASFLGNRNAAPRSPM